MNATTIGDEYNLLEEATELQPKERKQRSMPSRTYYIKYNGETLEQEFKSKEDAWQWFVLNGLFDVEYTICYTVNVSSHKKTTKIVIK